MGFAICWKKDFLEKEALLAQKESRPKQRMVNFVLEDTSVKLWESEPILCNGEVCGYTSSACFSQTLGRIIAMGYLKSGQRITAAFLRENYFTIENLGRKHGATAFFSTPSDPKRLKVNQ